MSIIKNARIFKFDLVIIAWLLSCLQVFADTQPPQKIRALTFNIMVDWAIDSWMMEGIPLWFQRKKNVFTYLGDINADILAIQEPLYYQVNGIIKNIDHLEAVRHPYFTDSVLLYSRRRFSLLKKGIFWLSARPQVEYSTDFGNPWPRLCVWADLQDLQTQKSIRVYAVHFDARRKARGKMAQALSKTILDAKDEIPPFVIAMGDFNINITDSEYETFLKSFDGGMVSAQPPRVKDDFFPATRADVIPTYRQRQIDHIFVSSGENSRWKVVDWQVKSTTVNHMPLSDHQAVYADLEFVDSSSQKLQRKRLHHERR